MLTLAHAIISCSLLLTYFAAGTSPPNYSRSTAPVMDLRINRLDATRPETTFGEDILPATNGYLELVCTVEWESVEAALGVGNMTLQWNQPIQNMIKQKRAFEKNNGPDFKTRTTVAIIEMLPEDGGEYICTLIRNGEDTGYKQSIIVPDLEGSPILKCDLDCERNKDEACQILQYHSVHCVAKAFVNPQIQCRFDPCHPESSCPQVLSFPEEFTGYDYDAYIVSSGPYQKKTLMAGNGLATVSGRYYCEAKNYKGKVDTSIYLPVSAGREKHPELSSYENIQRASDQFFGKLTPAISTMGDKVTVSCYSATHEIEWTYHNITSNQTVHHESINSSYPDMYLNEEKGESGYISQIVIPELTLHHGGKYQCRQRSNNEPTLTFAIDTFTWGENSNMNQNLRITKLTGDSITMRCSINTVKRQPSIYWQKDGHDIGNLHYDISADYKELTIPLLAIEHSGLYSCHSHHRILIEDFELHGQLNLTVVDTLQDDEVIRLRSMISTLEDLKSDLTQLVAEKSQQDL